MGAAVGLPLLMEAVDAVLVTVVLAGQVGILAVVYLQQRSAADDLAVVDDRLTPLTGRPSRWVWLGAAGMAVPVLLSAGVAWANPYGTASMQSRDDTGVGGAVAVAWPAGHHPVIVGTVDVRFCDNDVCDRYVLHYGAPGIMDGSGTVGIGSDGTVIKAALTGGLDTGGPFIHYGRCTRQDGCRQAWVPVRASAREPFGWPELAASSAPDGAVWFALAMPSSDVRAENENQQDQLYRITLIRCADAGCTRPERHLVGTISRAPTDGLPDGRRARLSFGADGSPVAAFRTGRSVRLATCEPVTCASPRITDGDAEPPDAPWVTPTGIDDEMVSLFRGGMQIGDHQVWLATDVAKGSGAVAVAGSRVYAVAAVPATAPTGFRVTFGRRPDIGSRPCGAANGRRASGPTGCRSMCTRDRRGASCWRSVRTVAYSSSGTTGSSS